MRTEYIFKRHNTHEGNLKSGLSAIIRAKIKTLNIIIVRYKKYEISQKNESFRRMEINLQNKFYSNKDSGGNELFEGSGSILLIVKNESGKESPKLFNFEYSNATYSTSKEMFTSEPDLRFALGWS